MRRGGGRRRCRPRTRRRLRRWNRRARGARGIWGSPSRNPAAGGPTARRNEMRFASTGPGRRVRGDEELVGMIVDEARRRAAALQAPDPSAVPALERERKSVDEKIGFIFDNPGEGETDRKENARRLAKLRAERSALERRLAE